MILFPSHVGLSCSPYTHVCPRILVAELVVQIGEEGKNKARLERILSEANVPILSARSENYRELLLSPDLYFPWDPKTDGTAIWFDPKESGETKKEYHKRINRLSYTHRIPDWLHPKHESRGGSHHYYCVVCPFNKSRSDQVSNHVREVHLRYFYKCPEAVCTEDEELWMAKEHIYRGCEAFRDGGYRSCTSSSSFLSVYPLLLQYFLLYSASRAPSRPTWKEGWSSVGLHSGRTGC